MSYKEYLQEFEDQSYVNTSNLTPSTDDFMYPNAKAMEIYSQGKRFQIEDNLIYYEIVKIVRDIVDRHFYSQQVQFYIQIANKAVIFKFVIDKVDAKYSYFVETLYMFITTQIYRRYGTYFTVTREDELLGDNKIVLKVKVEKTKEE